MTNDDAFRKCAEQLRAEGYSESAIREAIKQLMARLVKGGVLDRVPGDKFRRTAKQADRRKNH